MIVQEIIIILLGIIITNFVFKKITRKNREKIADSYLADFSQVKNEASRIYCVKNKKGTVTVIAGAYFFKDSIFDVLRDSHQFGYKLFQKEFKNLELAKKAVDELVQMEHREVKWNEPQKLEIAEIRASMKKSAEETLEKVLRG